MPDEIFRPRLVLLTTLLEDGQEGIDRLKAALEAGDVASVLIDPAGRVDADFQHLAEKIVPIVQDAGAAAVIVDDTRCAGRVGADGIHLSSGSRDDLADLVKRFSPKLIVGASGFATRHAALEAGELMPDYLFFGRPGGDTHPEPHDKAVDLAGWWAELVEIPAIIMGGTDIDQLSPAAASGAEFVALSAAVFGPGADPAAAVAKANALFDQYTRSTDA
ncbi:thiamine phosphate synthase [Consotaella salsifontis]|uniref:Thiamine-phosphate pyrophosphorylase n=1 Tax=Consotaella salsifontis TaxID=1365950 RepID=A0A1T4T404_9HYPH|nr:thiamine phosphate synthase [Consotaella salsifontis]SKA34971.1 thiamine-phosphate pyrophosphorylase [Consotaella salsifontis]